MTTTNSKEPEGTTLNVYSFVVKKGKPVGPREVMRGASLSSPSVAYWHLQKLESSGLLMKNESGEYVVKEKTGISGHVWIGKNLIPRLMVYSLFFLGVIIIGAVAIKLIAIIGRSASSILSGESMEPLMNPFSTMAVFGAHSFFGIATLASAIWLIALWRPRSTDFAVKSKRIWQSTVILWVLAFAVGLLLYVALTTTLL